MKNKQKNKILIDAEQLSDIIYGIEGFCSLERYLKEISEFEIITQHKITLKGILYMIKQLHKRIDESTRGEKYD